MPNENKTKLMLLIVTKLSESDCKSILSRLSQSQIQALANSKEWREELHPRDGDGQFASSPSSEKLEKEFDDELTAKPTTDRITEQRSEVKRYIEDAKALFRRTKHDKHTPLEQAKIELYELQREKPRWNFNPFKKEPYEPNEAMKKQIELLERIHVLEKMERRKTKPTNR